MTAQVPFEIVEEGNQAFGVVAAFAGLEEQAPARSRPQREPAEDRRLFQWACGEERPELKRLNAITNPHSPDEYRINGVVSNMHQFGRAFACKVGQPMVREKPCRVW